MNLRGNPNIAVVGMNTRFGQSNGANPVITARERNPQSIRAALRRLAAAEIDINKPITKEVLVRILGRDDGRITMAQLLAVRKFEMALKGDAKALQQITDDIDGKQVERKLEARTTLEELVTGSYNLED